VLGACALLIRTAFSSAIRSRHGLNGTTQRYMHLSPAALEGAMRLLDASRNGLEFGHMLATGSTDSD